MHVDSGSAISVLVCRNIFVGTPPKLKEAAGHLSKVRLKFAQIKLWHVDIRGGEDPVRLPEHCRSSFRKTDFKFCLLTHPLLSFQTRPAIIVPAAPL